MNETKEDCYFWIDEKLPENEQKINILCEKCQLKNPDLGWFWEGSKLGYGPFDFICSKCNHIIHSKSKE
jgi:hypothetical protein